MKTNGYGLVAVKIIKGIDIYPAGQIAGFVPAIAKKMIDGGFAELYKDGLGDQEAAPFAAANVAHAESQTMLSAVKAASVPAETPASAETEAANGDGGQGTGDGAGQGDGGQGTGDGAGQGDAGDIIVMGIDDQVVIPADWKARHHTEIKMWARLITGEAQADKESAINIINTAINARTAA